MSSDSKKPLLRSSSADMDPTVNFFYRPHNVSFLLLFIGFLVYYAEYSTELDPSKNLKTGLGVALITLILVSLLQFKDGPFIRPHPAVWRIVLGTAVAYQICLTLLLFQTKDSSRQVLKFIDPSLGVPIPAKNYADKCDLTWKNIVDQIDIFVVAHTVGWFAKAIILRDYWLCWVISVLFEVMEYSLSHQLPNFAECWWDHWILDVLTSNWLGIYLGVKVCEYFEMKQYSFRKVKQINLNKETIERGIQQFSPQSWTKFEWGTTQTLSRYLGIIAIIVLELLCELNAFYLKSLLWIPVEHYLNPLRLVYFFLICLPATKEAYEYLTDPECTRLGMYAWMCIVNILTELLIIVKYARGEFKTPFPEEVINFWIVFGSLIVGYPVWKFGISGYFTKHRKVLSKTKKE